MPGYCDPCVSLPWLQRRQKRLQLHTCPARPPLALQESPREAFDFWTKTLKRAYASVEVSNSWLPGSQTGIGPSSQASETICSRHLLQEYEKRFETWLDNLKYVLDYNTKHTSHWVRRQRCRRPLLWPAHSETSTLFFEILQHF